MKNKKQLLLITIINFLLFVICFVLASLIVYSLTKYKTPYNTQSIFCAVALYLLGLYSLFICIVPIVNRIIRINASNKLQAEFYEKQKEVENKIALLNSLATSYPAKLEKVNVFIDNYWKLLNKLEVLELKKQNLTEKEEKEKNILTKKIEIYKSHIQRDMFKNYFTDIQKSNEFKNTVSISNYNSDLTKAQKAIEEKTKQNNCLKYERSAKYNEIVFNEMKEKTNDIQLSIEFVESWIKLLTVNDKYKNVFQIYDLLEKENIEEKINNVQFENTDNQQNKKSIDEEIIDTEKVLKLFNNRKIK